MTTHTHSSNRPHSNRIIVLLAATFICAAAFGAKAQFDNPLPEPQIPPYSVSITDFDGKGDGITDNTASFAKAFAHLRQHGGGHLNVPAGIWLTGPISLESHVDLHLEEGCMLYFSDNINDYPLFKWDVIGNSAYECVSPISAFDKHDISITGTGSIDGRGQAWRPVKKAKLTDGEWKKLCEGGVLAQDGKTWYPSEAVRDFSNERLGSIPHDSDSLWEAARPALRPVMVLPVRCQRVLLEGVTFSNSPRWNIRPLLCRDLVVRDITVRNPYYAQNGDGIDIESCTNVHVTGCTFDVGDDAICLKSGRDEEGRRRGVPTSNVLIENCKVYHGHGGFVIGSEMSGGVHGITVRNCTFAGTDTGIKFKSTRGRGGSVHDVRIDSITMTDIVSDAITIDFYYGIKGAPGHAEVSESTPVLDSITMNGVLCSGARRAIWINGLPEKPAKNIIVSNSTFTSDNGAEIRNVCGITLDNVVLNHRDGRRIVLENATDFKER